MHFETSNSVRARLVLWVFIFFALTFGAGLYWNFQGENMGQAAETINASKETVMTNTLVGYWTLDGNDIVWGDANEIKDVNPGTKHDGNIAGSLAAGSAVPGRTGQGLLFNGTTDSISLGSVYNGVKTIAFWVKPNTTTQSLIDLNATATVDINAGTVRGNNFATPTIYVDGAATSTFPDTGWHHVAVTTGTGINASAAYIGQISPSYFGGIMDDIRFYSDALTATQIADLYRASGAKEISNANHREALTNGLVGYWTFDGRDIDWDDANEIKDISGNGNHGNSSGLTTASVTPGKLGQGLSFNGSSDYVNTPAGAIASIGTMSAWFKSNLAPDINGDVPGAAVFEIFDQRNNGTNIFQFCSWYENRAYDFGWVTSGTDYRVKISYTNFPIKTGTWYHVAMTWNDTTNETYVYLNGVLVGSNAASLETYTPTVNGRLGGHPDTPLNGSLDDVRIYNRAFSAAEVLSLYMLGK